MATQDETLRKDYFKGLPEMVMNYFKGLAEEVRGYLAELGVEKLTDLIGRTDLLEVVEGMTAKQSKLISPICSKHLYHHKICHCTAPNRTRRLIKGHLTRKSSKMR